MKPTLSLAFGAAAIALAACGDTPKLPTLNYAGPQEAASIRISDPQLYRRESLINERRDEKTFLEGLLAKTKEDAFADKFTPEVVRQVELVRTLSASLGLKFSPAEALAYKQDKQKAELEQSIDLLNLETKLAQLRRDTELLQTQLAQQTTPSGTTITSGATNPTGTAAPPLATLLNKFDALTAAIKEKNAASPVTPTAIKASPRDIFRDLQDYRSDLKAAINAVNLDELHDANGNTLARLNLEAVVLPGPRQDVLGMVRLTPRPPELNDSDLRQLYQEWLSFASAELNRSQTNTILTLMGTEGKLFRLFRIQGESTGCQVKLLGTAPPQAGCDSVTIVLPPDQSMIASLAFSESLDSMTKKLVIGTDQLANLVKDAQGNVLFGDQAFSPTCRQTLVSKSSLNEFRLKTGTSAATLMEISRNIQALRPGFDAALRQILDTGRSQGDAKTSRAFEMVNGLNVKVRPWLDSAKSYLAAVGRYFPECGAEASMSALPGEAFMHSAPSAFISYLHPNAGNLNYYRGQVRVYDVSPQISSQRLSTATRVSDAVQLAAELAASVPNAGVGASAGLGYTRAQSRKADALERTPVVVGFAEAGGAQSDCPYQYPAKDDNVLDPCYPSFGWILGPRLVPDPTSGDLVFQHQVNPHVLGVDLSVPGWWPAILLDVKTAWAPQWQTGGSSSMDLTAARKVQTLRVPLPHNKADMQSLTDVLANAWMGGLGGEVAIDSVGPAAISSCAAKATLQVRGPNLWRTSAAFIGASALGADSISVLPDMQGVAITFTPNTLPLASPAAGSTILSVVTPNGKADKELKLTGNGKTGSECRDILATPPSDKEKQAPTITSVVPNTLSGCETLPRFLIIGENLENVTGAMLGTVPSTKPVRRDTHVDIGFDDKNTMASLKGLDKVTLALTTKTGLAATEIMVKTCPLK